MKTVKKILTIVGNVLLAVLLLIGIVVLASMLPIKNNYKMLTVRSGSMAPAIPVGSVVIVKPAGGYVVGDVITFPTPYATKKDDYTTHRIKSIENIAGNITYTTKGDANQTADYDKISESKVVGKQYLTIPWVGYLLGYIKTLPGLIFIIVMPSTIIVYEEIRKLRLEAKRLIKLKREKAKEKKAQLEKAVADKQNVSDKKKISNGGKK
jgi:signal peptidase